METVAKTERLTRPTAAPATFDAGPGPEGRIGLLALATDQVSEGALRAMLPGEAVALYTARLANANPTTLQNLRRMAPGITAATELLLPDERIDAVMYACTSGAIAIGDDRVSDRIWRARPGVPVIAPGSAVIESLKTLGALRVSLVLPYVDEVSACVRGYLEDFGVQVVDAVAFGLSSDADMARLSPTALMAAAQDADHPEADAVCILCTALRAPSVIAPLEAKLGKPVVTSHQAMLWMALRTIGYRRPLPGFGRLMTL